MKKQTLKIEIYELLMDAGKDYSKWDTVNKIMEAINKRANKIDVGECIKTLMWDADKRHHQSLSYGDISEYIENKIAEEFK
jgi:hypothetical protein